jgi:hypothetical protein
MQPQINIGPVGKVKVYVQNLIITELKSQCPALPNFALFMRFLTVANIIYPG